MPVWLIVVILAANIMVSVRLAVNLRRLQRVSDSHSDTVAFLAQAISREARPDEPAAQWVFQSIRRASDGHDIASLRWDDERFVRLTVLLDMWSDLTGDPRWPAFRDAKVRRFVHSSDGLYRWEDARPR